jgi:sulfotransferase family protein
MRIAMWSGPRNLSTAMMYSFGNRPDCAIWDEPFYAAYLAATGLNHPMRDAIIAAGETDPVKVAERCLGPIPGKKPHFYMKHMPHHMVEGMPVEWAKECVNVHLIRHPARVIASYGAKRNTVDANDIGFRQQAELYSRFGGLVIDSADVRKEPETMLKKLCAEIGLFFDHAMLHWPTGGRPEDGAWAPHWYGSIHRSNGFSGVEGPMPELDSAASVLADEVLPFYRELEARKINL